MHARIIVKSTFLLGIYTVIGHESALYLLSQYTRSLVISIHSIHSIYFLFSFLDGKGSIHPISLNLLISQGFSSLAL